MNRTLAVGLGAYAAFGLATLAMAHNLAGAPPDLELPIVALLVAWQVYYVLFMIPKMGPTVDMDLFWPTYIVLAFFGRISHRHAGTRKRVALDYPALTCLQGCDN